MPDVKISELPEFTADPAGVFIPMVNAGETETFKILRENLVGDSGTSGSSGSSGTSGISGSSGSSGTSGISGSSGSSGTSGDSGSSGSSGTSGTSGIDGSSGSSGTSGTSGDTGAPGTSGTSGTSGGGGGGFAFPARTVGGPAYTQSGSVIPGPTGSYDRLFATFYYDTGVQTWNSIELNLATASSTGDVINFAIYNSQRDDTYGIVPYQRVTQIMTIDETESNIVGLKTRAFSTPWTPTEGVYWLVVVYTNATTANPTARLGAMPAGQITFHNGFVGFLYGLVQIASTPNQYVNPFRGGASQTCGLRYETAGPLADEYVLATLGATAAGTISTFTIGHRLLP